MFVSTVRKYKVFVASVTFLPKTHLSMRPTINLLILNVIPLLYTNNCKSAPNLNIHTIPSALQTLEYVHFLKNNTLFLERNVLFFLNIIRKKETYDGEPSGRRIRRVTTTFWSL